MDASRLVLDCTGQLRPERIAAARDRAHWPRRAVAPSGRPATAQVGGRQGWRPCGGRPPAARGAGGAAGARRRGARAARQRAPGGGGRGAASGGARRRRQGGRRGAASGGRQAAAGARRRRAPGGGARAAGGRPPPNAAECHHELGCPPRRALASRVGRAQRTRVPLASRPASRVSRLSARDLGPAWQLAQSGGRRRAAGEPQGLPHRGPHGPPHQGLHGPPHRGPHGPPHQGPHGPPHQGPHDRPHQRPHDRPHQQPAFTRHAQGADVQPFRDRVRRSATPHRMPHAHVAESLATSSCGQPSHARAT